MQQNCNKCLFLPQSCIKNIDLMKQTRNTLAKSEISKLLADSRVALSHLEIQAQLEGLCDRVTIYRVLDRLVEEGKVHRVININGVIKFAGCHDCSHTHRDNHVHFSCNSCKAVTCLDGIEPLYELPADYVVYGMQFTVIGLCPDCARPSHQK